MLQSEPMIAQKPFILTLSAALRCVMLAGCWLALSGFACPIFCDNQTTIQVDYSAARDDCRDYSESKLSAMSGETDPALGKTKLVAFFSECMKGKGWEVPGPTGAAAAAVAAAPAGAANAPAAGAATAAYDREAMQRAADCAWARQNATKNQVAATRAQACDMECYQRLQANPYSKQRPAACGPEYPEDRVKKRMIGNMEAETLPAAGAAAAAATTEPAKKEVKKTKKKPAKKKPQKKKAAPKAAEKKPVTNCDMPSAQTVLDKALTGSECPQKAP